MLKKIFISAILSSIALSFAEGPQFEPAGNIQVQGAKSFKSGVGGNNMDEYFTRVNFGGSYSDTGLESKINLRFWPEKFGNKFAITEAWVKFFLPTGAIRLGRTEASDSKSLVSIYGSYLEKAPQTVFKTRLDYYNMVEYGYKTDLVSSSLMFGVKDSLFNTGFVRFLQKFTLAPVWNVSVGYKSNIWDLVQNKADTSELLHNFILGSSYTLNLFTFNLEAAYLQFKGYEDQFPVMLGITAKVGKVIDQLALETEILTNRSKTINSKQDVDKNRVLLSLSGNKKVHKRLNIEGAVFSDETGADFLDFSSALRITASIK